MIREILFRGKRVDNGEWVEGFYVCLNGKEHRIYSGFAETDCGDYYPDLYTVDPETIGQFTGLPSKNGEKIFEGDIVEINHISLNGAKGVVVFRCGTFFIKYLSRVLSLYAFLPWCKVIGNIHDNPNLMEDRT